MHAAKEKRYEAAAATKKNELHITLVENRITDNDDDKNVNEKVGAYTHTHAQKSNIQSRTTSQPASRVKIVSQSIDGSKTRK